MALLLTLAAVALSLAMAGAWVVQRAIGNGGWADVVWSFATGAVAAGCALAPVHGGISLRGWLAAGMALAWSAPLGSRLAQRTAAAKREDARYADFRRAWGAGFELRMFIFLQIQAAAAWVLVVAVCVAAHNPAPGLAPRDVLAALVLLLAVVGEAMADIQLQRFKSLPANAGKVCDIGLWSWSRHPNYFFEWLAWCAWPLMALDVSGRWPWGALALLAPIQMFVLLRFVSGVPPNEVAMAKSRGAAFAAYQARVGAFFPAPPKPRRGPA
jgi:steroid 5-alpha reductase family enzyme